MDDTGKHVLSGEPNKVAGNGAYAAYAPLDDIPEPLAPGVHRLPPAAYHADQLGDRPALSATLAKILLKQSPLHAWHASPRLNPDHEPVVKDTFDIGHASHRAVLGVGAEWVVYPAGMLGKGGAVSTNAAKEWGAEQRAAGLTPIKAETEEKILASAEAVRGVLEAAGIKFAPARSEVAALAEIDGTLCRCMIDNAPANPREPLYDLKTTTDASPDAVMRAVQNYGYDVQAAHYTDTWEAATGEKRTFRFIFIEKAAPHAVTIAELDGEALEMARRRASIARGIWDRCLRSGDWPGYPLAVLRVGVPDWFNARTLDDEATREEWRVAAGDKPTMAAKAASYRAQMPDSKRPHA